MLPIKRRTWAVFWASTTLLLSVYLWYQLNVKGIELWHDSAEFVLRPISYYLVASYFLLGAALSYREFPPSIFKDKAIARYNWCAERSLWSGEARTPVRTLFPFAVAALVLVMFVFLGWLTFKVIVGYYPDSRVLVQAVFRRNIAWTFVGSVTLGFSYPVLLWTAVLLPALAVYVAVHFILTAVLCVLFWVGSKFGLVGFEGLMPIFERKGSGPKLEIVKDLDKVRDIEEGRWKRQNSDGGKG